MAANSHRFATTPLLLMVAVLMVSSIAYAAAVTFNYTEALSKSILFLECQRSGRIPATQRIKWRWDSALLDGKLKNVDLLGGYYDAGDNVKFGFPMAYTVTILAWTAIEFPSALTKAGELGNVRDAIRWGTDYFLKASAVNMRLWVQVGAGQPDHDCWERPEGMDTPRSLSQINASYPGTEVAAETAAALAAASIVFRSVDSVYAEKLLNRSYSLFHFADNYRASFTGQCPFYCSYSGYNDELMWAAAWLLKASMKSSYLDYIRKNMYPMTLNATEFSWDNKYGGYAVLLSNRYFMGDTTMAYMKGKADYFMCANVPGSDHSQIPTTPGGLLYLRPGANTQYAGGAAFLATIYSGYLAKAGNLNISCGNKQYSPKDLLNFARSQVDYVLGKNPLSMSYMVGFGAKYPQQPHHRGASIPLSYNNTASPTQCVDGFVLWFHRDAPNPNIAMGAIVGGPGQYDEFNDSRLNSVQLEPTTYINALFAGPLARLSQYITSTA